MDELERVLGELDRQIEQNRREIVKTFRAMLPKVTQQTPDTVPQYLETLAVWERT